MLSRVADTLYWMSRYLERAEHTARVVDVNLNLMLDQSPDSAGPRWEKALASLRAKVPEGTTSDPYAVCRSLTFDLENPSSISACIASARENARQVRELIGSEMWEGLNRLYFQVRRASLVDIWSGQPQIFFQGVKDGINLFRGITDSTLCQGEAYHFLDAGRYLERASLDRRAARRPLRPHRRLGRPRATPRRTSNGSACSPAARPSRPTARNTRPTSARRGSPSSCS